MSAPVAEVITEERPGCCVTASAGAACYRCGQAAAPDRGALWGCGNHVTVATAAEVTEWVCEACFCDPRRAKSGGAR